MHQTTNKLTQHIIRSNKAMELLIKNHFDESFMILLLAWVDRMSWLSIENELSKGAHFKEWLNKYLFSEDNSLPCDADDLWASRCSLMHMGTAEGQDVKKGKARKICYYGGSNRKAPSVKEGEIAVHNGDLHMALFGASCRFLEHLENKPLELEIANKKLDEILVPVKRI